jgi:hypothetical protein
MFRQFRQDSIAVDFSHGAVLLSARRFIRQRSKSFLLFALLLESEEFTKSAPCGKLSRSGISGSAHHIGSRIFAHAHSGHFF